MMVIIKPNDEHLLEDFLKILEEKRYYKNYNGKQSIRDLLRHSDWKRVRLAARKYIPLQEHEIIPYIEICGKCSCYYTQIYELERNVAFRAIFNREWNTSDYRISCVCREEFSDKTKENLRKFYHLANDYRALSTTLRLMRKGSRI